MKKKVLTVLVVALLAMLTAAGCTQEKEAANSLSETSPYPVETKDFSTPSSDDEKMYLEEDSAVYEEMTISEPMTPVSEETMTLFGEGSPEECANCHEMSAYSATFLQEAAGEGMDKYGNVVGSTQGMLAPTHRAEGFTCHACHWVGDYAQENMGRCWEEGDYEMVSCPSGNVVLPEYTLDTLAEAAQLSDRESEVEGDAFCLNERCHIVTRNDLAEATSTSVWNPHASPHGDMECGECHKAHRESVLACSACHDDVDIPEGWIGADESAVMLSGIK